MIINIEILEKLKNEVMQNKNIARLQSEFALTPIMNSKNFQAANIMIKSTSFKSKQIEQLKKLPMLIIAGIIGLVIGIFYVIILESIKKRLKN